MAPGERSINQITAMISGAANFHQGFWDITFNVNLDSLEDAKVTREFRFSIRPKGVEPLQPEEFEAYPCAESRAYGRLSEVISLGQGQSKVWPGTN